MEFSHEPVMLDECINALDIKPDGIYVDGTVGGAGHSREIAKRLSSGRLICLDRDREAIETARERLSEFPCVTVVQSNFSEIKNVLSRLGIEHIDGFLLDLGVSSYQLDNPERGFSYNNEAVLDMRMSGEGMSAKDVVNTYNVEDLTQVIRDYSEEKFAWQISKAIVREREKAEIVTTTQLAEIIKSAMPARARREKNPCKRTFQAIRIEVNNELDELRDAYYDFFDVLSPGGRSVIITFHSLENAIAKRGMKKLARGCICPPDFPVCICGNLPKIRIIEKGLLATEAELERNRRSHSARVLVYEKL